MTRIRMARIDDRLMHGQIIIKWLSTEKYNKVIIVDDETASDPVLESVLRFIFPKDIRLEIFSIQCGIEAIKTQKPEDNVILLAKNLLVLYKMYQKGVKFQTINIGRIPAGADKKMLQPNVYLSNEDIKIIRSFQKEEIPIIIQMVPDSEPFYITDIDQLIN